MKCVLIDRKVGKEATSFVCAFSTDIYNPKGQNQKNECQNFKYLMVDREDIQ